MLETVTVAAAFLSQVCGISEVIDVRPGDRFGEQVVVITIPTSAEHEKVMSLLPSEKHNYSLHLMPLFGIGSFTGGSSETQEVLALAHVSPYNVYGTPEYREFESLLKGVETREAEVWASMTTDERRAAIEEEVRSKRSALRADFGNCWTDRAANAVLPVTANGQHGRESTQDSV